MATRCASADLPSGIKPRNLSFFDRLSRCVVSFTFGRAIHDLPWNV